MLHTILLIIHVFVSVGLVGLVLLQHGKGADAGAAFGSGASQTVFGARGSSSFLTRTTAALATIFFTTSLSLAYLSGQRVEHRSVTEQVRTAPRPVTPAAPPVAPKAPAVPMPPTDIPAAPPKTPSDVPAPPK
jgi:preprotein translocase subunit SecG